VENTKITQKVENAKMMQKSGKCKNNVKNWKMQKLRKKVHKQTYTRMRCEKCIQIQIASYIALL
jgi:hypothetical protein